jgi:hypothetical protein
VETDPTVMCQLLAGLPTVTVLGVVDEGVDTPLVVKGDLNLAEFLGVGSLKPIFRDLGDPLYGVAGRPRMRNEAI